MTTNEEIDAALAAIPGLTFAHCVDFFARRDQTPLNDAIIAAACDQHYREGEVEIDDRTIVSGSDEPSGDYVLAWVWTRFDKDAFAEAEKVED